MKVYLDNCCLQRPFDDRRQSRVRQEAEAVEKILALCEQGALSLVASEALTIEIRKNPDMQRLTSSMEVLKIAVEMIEITTEILDRARLFAGYGIMPLDALHLACAEAGAVDVLCTTDDKFLKRMRDQSSLAVRAVSPLELLEKIL